MVEVGSGGSAARRGHGVLSFLARHAAGQSRVRVRQEDHAVLVAQVAMLIANGWF
jgi:hypothetical protein